MGIGVAFISVFGLLWSVFHKWRDHVILCTATINPCAGLTLIPASNTIGRDVFSLTCQKCGWSQNEGPVEELLCDGQEAEPQTCEGGFLLSCVIPITPTDLGMTSPNLVGDLVLYFPLRKSSLEILFRLETAALALLVLNRERVFLLPRVAAYNQQISESGVCDVCPYVKWHVKLCLHLSPHQVLMFRETSEPRGHRKITAIISDQQLLPFLHVWSNLAYHSLLNKSINWFWFLC